MASPLSAKKSQGRQKIDIKLIESESARTTTFSKRKLGVFKKATELSTLCAAQIAVIVFSICGKAYSFGHPNLESVLHVLRNGNSMPYMEYSVHASKLYQDRVQELKKKWDKLSEEVENSKKKRKELNENIESSSFEISEDKLSALSFKELKKLKGKLERLQELLQRKASGETVPLEDSNGEKMDLENIEMEENEKINWLKL